jgi:formiminotetrahydrofolate cyclodeaminase
MTEDMDEFLRRVADATPVPGGGSIAALAGALAASLSGMVSGLVMGKEGYEEVQTDAREIVLKAEALRRRLLELVTLDADAFESVSLSFKLPKKGEEERKKRKAAIQASLREASLVPLETSERAVEALEVALEALRKGSRSAFTDAGVAGILGEACLKAAALNVKINLASIADEKFRAESEDRLRSLLERGGELARTIESEVASRM